MRRLVGTRNARLPHHGERKAVVRVHVDRGLVREAATEVLGQKSVEADDENAEALGGETSGLLRSEERLARARAACDRDPGLAAQEVEDVVLLLGQAKQLALVLRELDRERRADL